MLLIKFTNYLLVRWRRGAWGDPGMKIDFLHGIPRINTVSGMAGTSPDFSKTTRRYIQE